MDGKGDSNKRTKISEQIRNSLVISEIFKNINNDKIKENKTRIGQDEILINTISEKGFSIRIYSRKASERTLSVMSRSGGKNTIEFPNYDKMKYYLNNDDFINKYCNLLLELGTYDIKKISGEKRVSLKLEVVENNIEKFIDCLKLIVN